MIARSHAALLEARGVVVVVLATRIVVGYHKGDVIFGSLFLPSVPVHTSRIGEPRLVVLGVIAHLATADSCLPVLFEAHVQPTLLVVAVAGAQLVVLVHERVVEQPETQRPQLGIAAEGGILGAGSIDADGPRNGHHTGKVEEELLLVFLGREILAQLNIGIAAVVNVILRPMAETYLDEGDAGIGGITGCEIGIKLLGETLQLGIAPVGIVASPVASMAEGFVVVAPCLDIGCTAVVASLPSTIVSPGYS